VHAAAAQRIRHFQGRENRFFGQPGLVFHDGGRLVVVVLHDGAAIRGLAGGVGDTRHVVQAEGLGDAELRLHQDAVVPGVFAVGAPDQVGGEHHGDRHDREVIDRLTGEVVKDAFAAVHRST
jgi:hypothetical protein